MGNNGLIIANGQEGSKLNALNTPLKKTLYKEPLFSVTLTPGLVEQAHIERKTGQYQLSAKPSLFIETGIDYRQTLQQNLLFVTGLRGIAFGRNAIFKVPIKDINPNGYQEPYPPIKNKDFDLVISVPLLLEKRWEIKANKSAYVQAGINFRYSLGYEVNDYTHVFTDSNNHMVEVFILELNSNNNKKPWINYTIGGGYGWLLKNYNILKAFFVTNISFNQFVKGTYQINIPGKPLTTGTYGVTGSSIGIIISYGFTGLNKQAVREYEKKNKSF